jgi:hypothetical protein
MFHADGEKLVEALLPVGLAAHYRRADLVGENLVEAEKWGRLGSSDVAIAQWWRVRCAPMRL